MRFYTDPLGRTRKIEHHGRRYYKDLRNIEVAALTNEKWADNPSSISGSIEPSNMEEVDETLSHMDRRDFANEMDKQYRREGTITKEELDEMGLRYEMTPSEMANALAARGYALSWIDPDQEETPDREIKIEHYVPGTSNMFAMMNHELLEGDYK